jgi:hypothetical protein
VHGNVAFSNFTSCQPEPAGRPGAEDHRSTTERSTRRGASWREGRLHLVEPDGFGDELLQRQRPCGPDLLSTSGRTV